MRLADIMLAHFADHDRGGFFYTADDHEQLIARHKDIQDSSVPSGNALAATVLVRLGKLTGRADYLAGRRKNFPHGRAACWNARRPPAGQMLLALDMFLGPTPEIVLLGDPANADTAAVAARTAATIHSQQSDRAAVRDRAKSSAAIVRVAGSNVRRQTPLEPNPRSSFARTSPAKRRSVGRKQALAKIKLTRRQAERCDVQGKKAGAVGHEKSVDGARGLRQAINNNIKKGLLVGIQPKIHFEQPVCQKLKQCNCSQMRRLCAFAFILSHEHPMLLPQLWHK